jgi:hypothetical protein
MGTYILYPHVKTETATAFIKDMDVQQKQIETVQKNK